WRAGEDPVVARPPRLPPDPSRPLSTPGAKLRSLKSTRKLLQGGGAASFGVAAASGRGRGRGRRGAGRPLRPDPAPALRAQRPRRPGSFPLPVVFAAGRTIEGAMEDPLDDPFIVPREEFSDYVPHR